MLYAEYRSTTERMSAFKRRKTATGFYLSQYDSGLSENTTVHTIQVMVGGYAASKTVSLYLSTSDRQWHDDRRTKKSGIKL